MWLWMVVCLYISALWWTYDLSRVTPAFAPRFWDRLQPPNRISGNDCISLEYKITPHNQQYFPTLINTIIQWSPHLEAIHSHISTYIWVVCSSTDFNSEKMRSKSIKNIIFFSTNSALTLCCHKPVVSSVIQPCHQKVIISATIQKNHLKLPFKRLKKMKDRKISKCFNLVTVYDYVTMWT